MIVLKGFIVQRSHSCDDLADGSVYVGSSGGLNFWDPETSTWKTVPLGYHLQGQRIEALLTTHSDEVWVRTSAGIARLISTRSEAQQNLNEVQRTRCSGRFQCLSSF